MRVRATMLALGVTWAPGCGDREYECTQDVQCVNNKGRGYCELNGLCSFPDATCPSGRRYGEHAGDQSGTCVSPEDAGSQTSGGPTSGPSVEPGGSTSDDPTGAGNEVGFGTSGGPPCEWSELEYSYRVRLVPTGAVADSTFDDHVVLVSLDDTRIDYTLADPLGLDLKFVREDDGSALPYEIERWNAGDTNDARSEVWVRWGDLGSESDSVLMYFGRPGSTPMWTSAQVWSDDYEVVAHLDAPVQDATEHSPLSVHGSVLVEGQVAGGQELEAPDEYIDVGSGPSVDDVFASGGTLSAWIFPEEWGGGAFGRIADKSDGVNAHEGWALMVTNVDQGTLEMRRDIGPTVIWRAEPGAIKLGQWQWVTMIFDETELDAGVQFYVDGAPVEVMRIADPVASELESDADHSLWIGNRTSLEGRTFDGTIDEFRLARTKRSPAFVQTQYRSMRDLLLEYGDIEERPPQCE